MLIANLKCCNGSRYGVGGSRVATIHDVQSGSEGLTEGKSGIYDDDVDNKRKQQT